MLCTAFTPGIPTTLAQQPGWSPEPFRPATAAAVQPTSTAPKISTSTSSRAQDSLVQRWRKVDATSRDTNAARPYTQAIEPAASPVSTANHTRTTNAIEPRLPTDVGVVDQGVVQASHQASHNAEVPRTESAESEQVAAPRLNLLPPAPRHDTDHDAEPVRVASRTQPKGSVSSQPVTPAQWSQRSGGEPDPAPKRLRTPPTGNRSLLAQSQPPADSDNLPPANLPPANLPPPSLPPMGNEPKTSELPGVESMQDALQDAVPNVPNPFPASPSTQRSPSDREATPRSPAFGRDRDPPPSLPSLSQRSSLNCDEVRTFANQLDIKSVRVDSSPSFVARENASENTKENFVARAPSRNWFSLDGQKVAEGQLVDLTLGSVVIETTDGSRTSYLLRELSDPDQVYVAESWGIPVTCSLGDQEISSRLFADTTLTWKATGACHKPLYFEEVQLERYGHEWGPVVQPALSTITFFGNLAVLPYKMGIHPPNECQYPLGYYRPGECAPWTCGPVPISLRGALVQAGFVTGTAWALP